MDSAIFALFALTEFKYPFHSPCTRNHAIRERERERIDIYFYKSILLTVRDNRTDRQRSQTRNRKGEQEERVTVWVTKLTESIKQTGQKKNELRRRKCIDLGGGGGGSEERDIEML